MGIRKEERACREVPAPTSSAALDKQLPEVRRRLAFYMRTHFPPDVEKVIQQIKNGQTAEGLAKVKSGAAEGNADYCYLKGTMLADGLVLEKNDAEARQCFLQAAEKGHPYAMIRLAHLLCHDKGGAREPQRAFEWLSKAVETGNAHARYWLGMAYEAGEFADAGIPQNNALAGSHYQRGSDLNDTDCQFALSRLYFNGTGVPQDMTIAVSLAEKAAAQDHALAQETLAWACFTGAKGLPVNKKRAEELCRRAARNGSKGAGQDLCNFPPLLNLSHVICSPFITSKLSEDYISDLLTAYTCGNWGDISLEHWDENDKAARTAGVIIAVYETGVTPVMIFSSDSGEITCVQHPDEDPPSYNWGEVFMSMYTGMKRAYKFANFLSNMGR
jgi:TPR repeat protein